MPCFPYFPLRKGKALEEEAEKAAPQVESQAQKNAKDIEVADAKLKGSATHTDTWTNDLGKRAREDKREYKSAEGSISNGYHCIVFKGKDTYAGEFKDGKFHGHGEHTFPDGERYDGEWRFGMQHGIGLKSWPDGTAFKGFYRLDARNGLGVCLYADGTRYCGMWINNEYDGVGKLEWPPDSMHPGSFTVMAGIGGAPVIVHGKSFLGHFLGGKKHGSGLHSFYDGSFYQGEYSEGLYHGNGVFQFGNGDRYEGEWAGGAFHGKGELWFGRAAEVPAGEAREGYVGEFANGQREGTGVLYFRNGGRFEGAFSKGSRKGVGLHVFPDGRQIRGEWWQYRDARDTLPSKVRDTLLLSHTMSEEAIFELMFGEKLPDNEEEVELEES